MTAYHQRLENGDYLPPKPPKLDPEPKPTTDDEPKPKTKTNDDNE
jgi:hypothetical protein